MFAPRYSLSHPATSPPNFTRAQPATTDLCYQLTTISLKHHCPLSQTDSFPRFANSINSFAPRPNTFRIRTSEKHAHNPFRIRTSKTQHLKPFRMNTYRKRGRGDAWRDTCPTPLPALPTSSSRSILTGGSE